jgi:hypothetical protein
VISVVIGTCDRCGKPVKSDQLRVKVNGLWEHVVCPTVSLRTQETDPAA